MSYTELITPLMAGFAGALLVLIPAALYVRSYINNLDFGDVFQSFLESEEAKAKQTNATISRTSKEAQQRIGRDLIENSPLKSVLGFLSADTVEYITDHPECLPDVLNKWAPTIGVAYPIIEKLIGNLGGLGKSAANSLGEML